MQVQLLCSLLRGVHQGQDRLGKDLKGLKLHKQHRGTKEVPKPNNHSPGGDAAGGSSAAWPWDSHGKQLLSHGAAVSPHTQGARGDTRCHLDTSGHSGIMEWFSWKGPQSPSRATPSTLALGTSRAEFFLLTPSLYSAPTPPLLRD